MAIPYAPSRLGRVQIQLQSGWGTAVANGSFVDDDGIECEVGYPEVAQEAITTEAMRSNYAADRILAGSKSGATMSLTMPLHGWAKGATPSGDPATHPDAILLASALGGIYTDGYATNITSGGDTDTIAYSGAPDSNWIGQALMVPISGGYCIGWAKSVDSGANTVDLINALTAAPASSGTVYGSNTCFLSNDTRTPFTLFYKAAVSGITVKMVDCVVTAAKITMNAKGQPVGEVTIQATDWTVEAGAGQTAQYA